MDIKIVTTPEQNNAITRLRKFHNKQPLAVPVTDREFITNRLNSVVNGLIEEAERTCDGL